MLPTALSQIIEAVGKLVFGLLFAHVSLQKGYDTPTVAAFAGAGLTVGTMLSTLYLLFEKARTKPSAKEKEDRAHKTPYGDIWRHLARLSIPMTLGASVVSLTKLIDMSMILRRLQSIGYTEALANEAYGSYTTLALSLFGLLPTLVSSVALPLVPMLSSAIAKGDREQQNRLAATSFRLTALFAIPASLGISAFARPILELLFGSDPAAVSAAAPLLSYLGVSVFLSCMITATNSVLHAYRVVNRPILALGVGAAVKVFVAYFLIGNPSVALAGAPISTFFCNAVVVLLNFGFVTEVTSLPTVGSMFARPFWASVASVGISYGLYLTLRPSFGGTLLTLSILAITVLLYLVLACLFGAFQKEEILSLPFGERIYAMLLRLHLLKETENIR